LQSEKALNKTLKNIKKEEEEKSVVVAIIAFKQHYVRPLSFPSRQSLFRLVLAIIGSSLFGLALTNLYSIFSQPSTTWLDEHCLNAIASTRPIKPTITSFASRRHLISR
jgi:hypothetical protein